MPNKTEEYLALACKTADSFSRQWEHWAEFLITAARLYKYSYPNQLMIYAQRPDATACAEYDVWNNKMNRYVRRGSKGIALLDESGGYPRLHYVFDVSDTAPRRNALYPDLWQINDSLKEPVRSMLAENYGVHSESFGQQLADVAGKLVQFYWDNNSSDILGIVDGSYLMSYDDAGRELQFKVQQQWALPICCWSGADWTLQAGLMRKIFRQSTILQRRRPSMRWEPPSATAAGKSYVRLSAPLKRRFAAETLKGAKKNMSSNLNYTKTGDYFLPNLTLNQTGSS